MDVRIDEAGHQRTAAAVDDAWLHAIWSGDRLPRHRRDAVADKELSLVMNITTAYKILTADQWIALKAGAFSGTPVDQADGFIHLSTAAQLAETLDLHFSGQDGLVIAAIDLIALGRAVRWEPSRQGLLFPHVYARLTRNAVVAWCPLERDSKGAVRLPQ